MTLLQNFDSTFLRHSVCIRLCVAVHTTGPVTDIRMPKWVRWWHWQWVCVAFDRTTTQPSRDHWPSVSLTHRHTDRQTYTVFQKKNIHSYYWL